MSSPTTTPASHADNHDRDKLQRWWDDLRAEVEAHTQVHAVFLVDDSDKHAHDVFRRIRSAYQQNSAPFHALVIFGQHGSSAAARALAKGFRVPGDGMPVLIVFRSHQDATASVIPLGALGDSCMNGELADLLDRIIEDPSLSLTGITGLQAQVTEVVGGTVKGLVENTLARINETAA